LLHQKQQWLQQWQQVIFLAPAFVIPIVLLVCNVNRWSSKRELVRQFIFCKVIAGFSGSPEKKTVLN